MTASAVQDGAPLTQMRVQPTLPQWMMELLLASYVIPVPPSRSQLHSANLPNRASQSLLSEYHQDTSRYSPSGE